MIKPLTLWLFANLSMRHGEFIWHTPYGEPVTSWPPQPFSWRRYMKAKDSPAPTDAFVTNAHFMPIPVANIESSPTNPRKHFDEAELAELAASIKVNGVLQNIVVRPKQATPQYWARPIMFPGMLYELVAGERRWRAAQLAGLDTIPATVRDLTDAQVLEIQVIENEQRSDLSPLEKARGYQALLAMPEFKDRGVELLSTKVGKSAATIYGLLKLLELPKQAQQAVEDGELPMSSAQLIARIPDAKVRAELAKSATQKDHWGEVHASYRQIKQTIQHRYMIELKQAPFGLKDEALVSEAGSCEKCPKRTGNNRTEYPEGRADVCTDPSCYRGKLEAHRVRVLALAEEKGDTVLTGADAEKALGYQSKYYDLKDETWTGKKSQSYNYLVGKQLKDQVVIAVDDKGETHRLVPKKAADEVLKTEHKIKRGGGDDSYARSHAKRVKEARLKNKAGKEAVAQIVDKVKRAAQDGTLFTHAAWFEALVNGNADYSFKKNFIHHRGLKEKSFSHMDKLFKDLVAGMDVYDRLGLLVELTLPQALTSVSAYGGNGPERKETCEAFGVDLKALEKAAAEPKEKKAPKPSTNGHTAADAAAVIQKEADEESNPVVKRRLNKMAEDMRPAKPAADGHGHAHWEIFYHLKGVGTASVLAHGTYAFACEAAKRDILFKSVASSQKITKEEYERRTNDRFNARGKKKPAKKAPDAAAFAEPANLDTMEDGLMRALKVTSPRWARLQREGATDDELRETIAEVFGTFGSLTSPTTKRITMSARKGLNGWELQFWFDPPRHPPSGIEPTLAAQELVDKVRELLNIPANAASIDTADGDVARCCVCGCTEDSPCPGGCYWVDGDDMEDRCNRCVGNPIPERVEGGGRGGGGGGGGGEPVRCAQGPARAAGRIRVVEEGQGGAQAAGPGRHRHEGAGPESMRQTGLRCETRVGHDPRRKRRGRGRDRGGADGGVQGGGASVRRCSFCGQSGHDRRHCTRLMDKREGPSIATTFERCEEWFKLFGLQTDCISPTGRIHYQWLLEEVRRLRANR